ncbi:MAG: hypothetical protein JRN15_15675 [Nitrososphaerota archaeon]|nr:hypothetical protein [Nitrososphaerota archaeon]
MTLHRTPTARGIMRMMSSAANFPTHERAGRFEYAVAHWFSRILMIPLFTIDKLADVEHYVSWNGSISGWKCANAGQDVTCKCGDFDLIVDCTRSTGNTQWRMEFGSSVDHYQKHVGTAGNNEKEIFLILVCEDVSDRTHRSIRGGMTSSSEKFLAINTKLMAHIMKVSELSVTMNRLDFRFLLRELIQLTLRESDVAIFTEKAHKCVDDWAKKLLSDEEEMIIGVEAYKVLKRKIGVATGLSDIVKGLYDSDRIEQFKKRYDWEFKTERVKSVIINHRFGYKVGETMDGELLFQPMPTQELTSAYHKLIRQAIN